MEKSQTLKAHRKQTVKRLNWFLKLLFWLGAYSIKSDWTRDANGKPMYKLDLRTIERWRFWHPLTWVMILIIWVVWMFAYWWEEEGVKSAFGGWN